MKIRMGVGWRLPRQKIERVLDGEVNRTCLLLQSLAPVDVTEASNAIICVDAQNETPEEHAELKMRQSSCRTSHCNFPAESQGIKIWTSGSTEMMKREAVERQARDADVDGVDLAYQLPGDGGEMSDVFPGIIAAKQEDSRWGCFTEALGDISKALGPTLYT